MAVGIGGVVAAGKVRRHREEVIRVDDKRFASGTDNRLFAEKLTITMNDIIKHGGLEDEYKASTRGVFSAILKDTDIESFDSKKDKLTAFKIAAASFAAENPGYKKEMGQIFGAIETHDTINYLSAAKKLRTETVRAAQAAQKERDPKARYEGVSDAEFMTHLDKKKSAQISEEYGERDDEGFKQYTHGEGSPLYEAMAGRSSSAIAKALMAKKDGAETGEKGEIDIMALADQCPPKLLAKIARVGQKMSERADLEQKAAQGKIGAKVSLKWKDAKVKLSNFFKKVDIETIATDLEHIPRITPEKMKQQEEMRQAALDHKIAAGRKAGDALPAAEQAEKAARDAQSAKRGAEGRPADEVIRAENRHIDSLADKAAALRAEQQRGKAVADAPRNAASQMRSSLSGAIKVALPAPGKKTGQSEGLGF